MVKNILLKSSNRSLISILLSLLGIVFYYKVYSANIFVVLLLSVFSVLFYLLGGKTNKNKTVLPLAILVFVLLASFFYRLEGFNYLEPFKTLSADFVNARGEYFAQDFGILYKNRIGIFFFDFVYPRVIYFTQSLFQGLDLNLLINLANPLSIFILVTFILGLSDFIAQSNNKQVLFVLALFLLGGLLRSGSNYSLYVFVPIMVSICSFGLTKIVKIYEKK